MQAKASAFLQVRVLQREQISNFKKSAIMMYGAFVERTGVYVGIDEFNTIVEVYNNSDVDKDEFC